ncbi:hypothetical protein V1264_007913 [Littorina saxatilis]|uniref:Peptidase S1 domain-containing protein n=1 Tax=Littorina saxatilis TaxID=31220 RepID=A0AAN9AXG2_9CAEN
MADRGREFELNSRIIGGREADKCELPWMVYISLPNGPCGGAVIDERHVLTAAHCFWGAGSYTPEIFIGEYNRTETNPTEKLSTRDYKIFMHPGYIHEYYFNDIAIVQLDTPIDLNKYRCITPLCLPSDDQTFPAGIDCVVAGWGVTEPEYDVFSPPIPQVLMKVTISVVQESLCKRKFGKYYNITTETCAGQMAGDKDSCDVRMFFYI